MTVQAPAQRRRVRHFASSALATCLLGLLFSTTAAATGTIGTPTPVDPGLSCKDFDSAGILKELLVSPLPDDVTIHDDGTLSVATISFESTSGWLLYWEQLSSGQSIHHVSISGDGVGVLYSYDPPATHDEGLHLPAPTTLLQTVTTTTTTPGYPRIASARFCYSTPEETGFEGCTLGYWKVRQHHDSWPAPYNTGSSLQVAFGPDAFDDTFLEALNYKGGPGVDGGKRLLLKQAVAALLNATSGQVDYPITAATLTAQVAAALASNDREIMLSLATTLDAYNNQGCPIT